MLFRKKRVIRWPTNENTRENFYINWSQTFEIEYNYILNTTLMSGEFLQLFEQNKWINDLYIIYMYMYQYNLWDIILEG